MKITKDFAPITIVLEQEYDKKEFVNMLHSLIINYEKHKPILSCIGSRNPPSYVKLAEEIIRKIEQ